MEESRKFELKDDMLDKVAGGRGAGRGSIQYGVRNEDYACCNCGGHEFLIVDGDKHGYNGKCLECGIYNEGISRNGAYEIFPSN